MTCKETIQYDSNGVYLYHTCNKKAKYHIDYISPINGKQKTSYLCGLHFRAAQKNAASILKKTGFDCDFKFNIL